MYFYLENTIVGAIENFLCEDDVYLEAFVFYVEADDNFGLYFFDNLELYTFTTEYEGTVDDLLNEIKNTK